MVSLGLFKSPLRSPTPTATTFGLMSKPRSIPPLTTRRCQTPRDQSADFCAQGHTGVVLRFAAFYGPDAMQVRSYIDGLKWGWALLPGGPNRFISSISHDDAASAVVAALEAPQGIYNVADDQPVRRARYFELLACNLGLNSPNFVPEWATPLFGSVGQVLSRSLRLSNAKLRKATRWTPRFPSVREGWPAMLRDMGYGAAAPGR